MKRPDVRKNLRRGVYVIPTSFTVLNLFFGFRSIVNSTRGIGAMVDGRSDLAIHFFEVACLSLFFAAIFDTFDGLLARQLGATSEFGKEYDSLADVVTFGTAPAVLVYAWGLQVLGNLGGAIAFLFLVSVSLRLARFNVMTGKTDYRYFVGLPSPAGALTLASIIYYAPAPVHDERFGMIMLLVTAAVAFAMVSPIRYRSQKGMNLQKERSLMYIVVLALILGIFTKWPREFLFIGAICYLASGPLVRLWSIAFPSRKTPEELLQPAETH
ncbi:MAG: CDP-diacylglycerol--serine O-phosphatidyltransferase [Acidobacteria bacterium]|nr:MAG: CDP-diacylglycerol--serine O-phosphatidyltransferase [Acidobacteriota bacterium]